MNFLHWDMFFPILFAIITFIFIVYKLEKKFYNFIKTYWFYGRSSFSYLSSFFLCLGMGALLISLLDLRGPEERTKTDVPTLRTIILIDTSASMLAEDTKPSRLSRAVLLAKHFARKAAGHQISIVVFSEIQKKIVPFTSDLDLIDARLESVQNLRNQNGSSALSVAIQESIQYFKETGEARGNILVLTDGEETAESINLKIPENIHVALVGVGTERGGKIPLDDGRGFRFGYKKSKGKDVVTKLNEKFFQRVTADLPSAKYWLINSYSLPTDEILDFFKNQRIKGQNQRDMVVKPVMMEWIVVPAVICLILAYLFKAIKIFSLGLLLIVLPVHSQEPPELSPETISRLEELQKGELNQLEKIKLADDLYKEGAKEESLSLYEENLPMDRLEPEVPPEAYLNYGTALLEKGEGQKGIGVYESLLSNLDPESDKFKEIKNITEKNTIAFFKQEEKKKQQEKKEKDQKNKENKQGGEGSGQGEPGKDQGQSQKNPGKEQDKDKEKKDQENKDQKNEDGQNEDDKKKDEKNQGKDGDRKPLPPRKIPAKLKQLMSDDRQLQIKMIENGTRDLNKRNSRENKDW